MLKFKYILWFLQFIKWCIRDLIRYPFFCFNEYGLLKQNLNDFKTKIIFDSDKKYFHYSRHIRKSINKRQKHR